MREYSEVIIYCKSEHAFLRDTIQLDPDDSDRDSRHNDKHGLNQATPLRVLLSQADQGESCIFETPLNLLKDKFGPADTLDFLE